MGCDIIRIMPQNRDATDAELIAQLDWYAASGVDMAVSDTPIDQFAAQSALKQAAANTSAFVSAQPIAPLPVPEANSADAAALAASAPDLDTLRAIMDAFDGSPLKQRATQLVFADGNPEADIMLIGEAPGREEDLQGKPFVGRSGQLLDRMLAAIGLDRTKVYIVNTVPWRPPGNRTPSPAEIEVCLPFLHRQIALVAPKVLVTLGAPATQTMLGAPVSITKVRGQWRDVSIGALTLPLLPTFHPAFLLRQPAQKGSAWRDMLALKAAMDSAN